MGHYRKSFKSYPKSYYLDAVTGKVGSATEHSSNSQACSRSERYILLKKAYSFSKTAVWTGATWDVAGAIIEVPEGYQQARMLQIAHEAAQKLRR